MCSTATCFQASTHAGCADILFLAIDVDPQNPTYLSNRSAAFISANRYHEALEDAKLADELDPGNSKVLLRLARIYTNLGRPSDALDIYNQIQPPVSAKDKAPAVFMQTHIKQVEDVLREGTTGSMAIHALDQAERGLGVGVDRPRKWKLLRGEAYLKMGNVNALGDAQNVAMSLLRTNNQDPEALVLRGRVLYAQGENEKALQHFRQALSCDPDYKDGLKYLRMVQKLDRMKEGGNSAFKAGRYKEAVDVYSAALDVDPLNKQTNSKILQNKALAEIKVYSPVSSAEKVQGLIFIHSSKTTNRQLTTAPKPLPSIHSTSKPAKLKPAPSASPAIGTTPSVNTKPSPKITLTNPESPKMYATRSSNSKSPSGRTTTKSSAWKKTPARTKSRKRTASSPSYTTPIKTRRTKRPRNGLRRSARRTRR